MAFPVRGSTRFGMGGDSDGGNPVPPPGAGYDTGMVLTGREMLVSGTLTRNDEATATRPQTARWVGPAP